MKRKSLMLIVLGSLLTSCGLIESFKGSDTNTENIPTDGPSSQEMVMVDSPEASTPSHSDDEFDVFSDKPEEPKAAMEMTEPTPPKMVTNIPSHEVTPEINNDVMVDSGPRKIKFYKVKKGETLMQIAFKLYGDIGRWQDIKKLNQEKVSRNTALAANLTLKYEAPDTEFVWNPSGEPYVIGTGETLGIISNTVYQTPKRWKSIWENNKPLIKNPNIIFAGFTIYYIKDHNLANYVQPEKEQKPAKMADDFTKAEDTSSRDSASDIDNTTF
ncbi:MAG: LysM peptidoglycan-binding domain-containing protein [Bdellovibrionales bacterium]|nr:LysM peptidoglycan-binding domain-containing protein [Bdellovibrionales bacterium]